MPAPCLSCVAMGERRAHQRAVFQIRALSLLSAAILLLHAADALAQITPPTSLPSEVRSAFLNRRAALAQKQSELDEKVAANKQTCGQVDPDDKRLIAQCQKENN